jgi:hypothetical protein
MVVIQFEPQRHKAHKETQSGLTTWLRATWCLGVFVVQKIETDHYPLGSKS